MSAPSTSFATSGALKIESIVQENAVGCRKVARFWIEPVDRSSITDTVQPSFKQRSARCDPIKPAPPVIRTFISSPHVQCVAESGTWLCTMRQMAQQERERPQEAQRQKQKHNKW